MQDDLKTQLNNQKLKLLFLQALGSKNFIRDPTRLERNKVYEVIYLSEYNDWHRGYYSFQGNIFDDPKWGLGEKKVESVFADLLPSIASTNHYINNYYLPLVNYNKTWVALKFKLELKLDYD